MSKNKFLFISAFLMLSTLLGVEYDFDDVIARVGDREITVKSYLERAEYSPRPLYCRGSGVTDKRIILNTLIGEKLFSIENSLEVLPESVASYLKGIKEQKMREVLFWEVASKKELNESIFFHWYDLYNLEYDISYITVMSKSISDEIKKEIISNNNLEDIYKMHSKSGSIPFREGVNLFNIGNRSLREEVYKKRRNTGEIIGPVRCDDNVYMFVQINDVTKKVSLDQSSILQSKNQVSSIIDSHTNEKEFSLYVQEVMSGMSFNLDSDVYEDFVDLLKSSLTDESKSGTGNIDLDRTLLTLNGYNYSIGDVLKWIDSHPLVFRDGYYKEMDFKIQTRFALADLIRDIELNQIAYSLDIDSHPDVLSEYTMWLDNYSAIQLRDSIIQDNLSLSSVRVDSRLNEYFVSLAQKYTNQIYIDVEKLNSVDISSTDMIAYNKNGVYRFKVPQFPVITDHHQFDFGQVASEEE